MKSSSASSFPVRNSSHKYTNESNNHTYYLLRFWRHELHDQHNERGAWLQWCLLLLFFSRIAGALPNSYGKPSTSLRHFQVLNETCYMITCP